MSQGTVLLPPGVEDPRVDQITAVAPPSEDEKKPEVNHPAIMVIWNDAKKNVNLNFNPSQFQNWGFVIAVLNMGIEKAKAMAEQEAAVMQIKMMEAAAEKQALQESVAANTAVEIARAAGRRR